MANRQVVWEAFLRTAKFAKGAKDVEDRFKKIRDEERETNQESVKGSEAATKAHEKRARSTTDVLRRYQELARSAKSYTKAALQEATASQTLEKRQQALATSQQKLADKTTVAERAARRAEAAQRAYAAALAKTQGVATPGQAEKLARAEDRLTDSRINHSRALAAVAAVAGTVEQSEKALAASGNALGKSLNSIKGAATGAAGAIGRMPIGHLLFTFPAVVTAVNVLVQSLSALVGGLGAVAGAVGPAVGALAALPQMLMVGAGAIGTFMAAFSGIGDAVKQGVAAQEEAGQAARDTAEAESDAARQVVLAQRGVRDARERSGDAARQAARAIQSAARQVVMAERAIVEAHRDQTESYRSVIAATAAINDARQQAIYKLQDLKAAVEDEARSEERASLSVEQARERLAAVMLDPNASTLEKTDAKLAVEEAEARLDETRKQANRTRKEYQDAAKKGVEKSDEMVAARQAERQALLQLKQAQIGVRDSQYELAQAQRAMADAERDAARSRRDAAEGLADAQYNLKEALEDQAKAGEDASGAASKYAQAMEDLSPAARQFVRTLISLRGEWKQIKDAAAAGLLPGLGAALIEASQLTDLVSEGMFRFGESIGKTAQKLSGLITSPLFTEKLAQLLDSNVRILDMFGDGLVNIVAALTDTMVAAIPFTEWLSETIVGWTDSWRAMMAGEEGQARFAAFLDRARESLEVLGSILKNTFIGLKNTFGGGRDAGMDLLGTLDQVTQKWAEWTGSVEGQNRIKEYFDATVEPTKELFRMIRDITKAFLRMGESPALSGLLEKIRTELGPAIAELFGSVGTDAAPALIDLITNLADLLTAIGPTVTDVLIVFADAIRAIADAIVWANENVPGFSGAMKALLVVLGVGKILAFFKVFKMVGFLFKIFSKDLDGAAKGTSKFGRAFAKMKGVFSSVGKWLGKLGGLFAKVFMRSLKFVGSFVKGFGRLLGRLGPILMRAVGVVGKAMMAIGRAMMANPWMLLIAALVVIVILVVKYWDEIKAAVSKAISWMIDFIKNNWDIIKWFLGPMGLVIDQIIKHWDTIKKVFSKAIEVVGGFIKKNWKKILFFLIAPFAAIIVAIVKNWDKIKSGFSRGVEAVKRGLVTVWSKVKDWLTAPFKAAWEKGLKPIWDNIQKSFKTGADAIKETFTKLKEGIKTIWDGLKKVIASPIEFAINTVIDKWLIGNVNKVLGSIGLDGMEIPTVGPVKFARGGEVKPYARGGTVDGYGNRDSVKALLMPGEFVLRKDAVKRIGSERLHALNEGRSFRGQKFNFGGEVQDATPGYGQTPRYGWGDLVDAAKDAGSAAWDNTGGRVVGVARDAWGGIKDATGKLIDLSRKGASKGLELLLKPLRASLDKMPDAWVFDDMAKSVGNKLFDAAISWISGGESTADFPPSTADVEGAAGQPQKYAKGMLENFGWGPKQWSPLQQLWQKESGWNYLAQNPTSGAYGIPQALPASKMASAGDDWKTNPATQIKWGLDYIKGRYGSPAAAWKHSQEVGWYARGGKVKKVPAMLTPGEYVVDKQTVDRVGLGTLQKMNRGTFGSVKQMFARGGPVLARDEKARRLRKKEGIHGDASPLVSPQYLHRGGPVLGMKKGMTGNIPTALRWMLGMGKLGGSWDSSLDSKLSRVGSLSQLNGPAALNKNKANKLLSYVKSAKVERKEYTGKHVAKGGENLRGILQQYYGDPSDKEINKFLTTNNFTKTVKEKKTTKVPGTKGVAGNVARARSWASSQAGKPYIWGGSGPTGYDCSGFQSAITNVMKGNSPYTRQFATASMASVLPRLGFRSGLGGPGDYSVGWYTGSPGHTSGTVGGLNAESTGNHVRVGAAAKPASAFPNKMHLPGSGKSGTPATTKTTMVKKTVPDKSVLKNSFNLKKGTKLKLPDLVKWVGGRTFADVRKKLNLSKTESLKLIQQTMPSLKKLQKKNHKSSSLLKGYNNQWAPIAEAIDSLNDKMGLGKKGRLDSSITGDTRKALMHVLDHAYGRAHGDFATRPWQDPTAVEAAIQNQEAANKKQQQFNGFLETISGWGLSDLTDDLLSKGVTDGFTTAESASKDKHLATRLDDAIKKSKLLTSDDQSNLLKMISLLSTSGTPVGLRDLARQLGLSDLNTVQLTERARDAGRLDKVPQAKMNKLWSDIGSYRTGTFYANRGGQVPGVGNTDSVPAMLTPGEFVLRKAAVKALGLENIMAMNDPQYFAKGGFVAEDAFSLAGQGVTTLPNPGRGRQTRRSDAVLDKRTIITYDVDIHNPVAETGTRSLTKMLQRRGATRGTAKDED